jgi:hypothetical protein
MEGGADFYVDRDMLGEVDTLLLRDLTTQKSATKKCGREYWPWLYVEWQYINNYLGDTSLIQMLYYILVDFKSN